MQRADHALMAFGDLTERAVVKPEFALPLPLLAGFGLESGRVEQPAEPRGRLSRTKLL